MRATCISIINVVLTCVTVIVIASTCNGCNIEKAKQTQAVIEGIHGVVDTGAPAMTTQPWYIFILLAADIASSIAAGVVAFWQTKTLKTKD